MGIIRNFIEIVGITPESELPHKNNGQIIEYSDVENIFIPPEKSGIDNIYQIIVDLEIKSNRMIKASLGRICVIDGIKKFKIIYKEKGKEGKINILDLKLPFNTFIDLPNENINIENVKVYIADAYFDLIDRRKIYGHYIYIIDVHYNKANIEKGVTVNNISPKLFKLNASQKEEKTDRESKYELEQQSFSEVSLAKEFQYELKNKFNKNDNIDEDELIDIDSEYL